MLVVILMIRLMIVMFMLSFAIVAVAQDQCSAEVEDALSLFSEVCADVGQNELCYGNADIEDSKNIISLENVQGISTSGLGSSNDWEIALLKLQANIPDTMPDDNVSVLLFGDVTIENNSTGRVEFEAITTANPNLRSGASTSTSIIGSVPRDTALKVIGRNDDSTWLFVEWDSINGWIFADLLDIGGNVDDLAIVTDGNIQTSPMQLFRLTTGAGQHDCAPRLPAGILVQSPESDVIIRLQINAIDVLLHPDSTAFIQATPNDSLIAYVLQGEIDLSALGITQTIPEGAYSMVPIDNEPTATAQPDTPQPYDIADIQNLPLSALQRTVAVADPASIARITFVNDCMGTFANQINIRYGPGDIYPVRFSSELGKSYNIVGQATGTDNAVWYSLSRTQEEWVRSNLIALSDDDNCNRIPPIEINLPGVIPTPEDASEIVRGPYICDIYDIYEAKLGEAVQIMFGVGRWAKADDAEYVMNLTSVTVLAPGVVTQVRKDGPRVHTPPDMSTAYGFDYIYQLDELPAGLHVVKVKIDIPNGRPTTFGSSTPWIQTFSCTVIVT